jgi:hypothetical protein
VSRGKPYELGTEDIARRVENVSSARHPQSNLGQSGEPAPGLSEFNLGYYGWRVVLAACLGVMAGFGLLFVYTFAVFVKPLAAEFAWSREAVSRGFGLAAVTLGLVSPLLGRWIDRCGPRRIILPCMTVFGCAIASLALLRSELWQFYLTCIVRTVLWRGRCRLGRPWLHTLPSRLHDMQSTLSKGPPFTGFFSLALWRS